jgi:hypothetical protein
MAATRKRIRTWKRVAKKDRRNLKMWADGARESVLKPHIEPYTDALECGWRAEHDYLREVCNEFHARIPWRLGDHEEPELPLVEYDKFAKIVEEDLDEEEATMKRQHIETMNAVSICCQQRDAGPELTLFLSTQSTAYRALAEVPRKTTCEASQERSNERPMGHSPRQTRWD